MTTEMLRQQISAEQEIMSQGKLIKEHGPQTAEVDLSYLCLTIFLVKHIHASLIIGAFTHT